MRERKITLAALDRVMGAPQPDNMTRTEKSLYDSLVKTLADFRAGNAPIVEKECVQPFAAEMPKPEPEPVQATIMEPEPVELDTISESQETMVVHVLEDIPEFAGLSTDYELKKDDMVTIPSQFANILSSRGLVRIVSS